MIKLVYVGNRKRFYVSRQYVRNVKGNRSVRSYDKSQLSRFDRLTQLFDIKIDFYTVI